MESDIDRGILNFVQIYIFGINSMASLKMCWDVRIFEIFKTKTLRTSRFSSFNTFEQEF